MTEFWRVSFCRVIVEGVKPEMYWGVAVLSIICCDGDYVS